MGGRCALGHRPRERPGLSCTPKAWPAQRLPADLAGGRSGWPARGGPGSASAPGDVFKLGLTRGHRTPLGPGRGWEPSPGPQATEASLGNLQMRKQGGSDTPGPSSLAHAAPTHPLPLSNLGNLALLASSPPSHPTLGGPGAAVEPSFSSRGCQSISGHSCLGWPLLQDSTPHPTPHPSHQAVAGQQLVLPEYTGYP